MTLVGEVLPNETNRVTLAEEKDEYGVPVFTSTETSDESAYSKQNNRFANNHYRVDSLMEQRWFWNRESVGWAKWQEMGQDTNGTVTRIE